MMQLATMAEARTSKAIYAWAGVGVAVLALQIWIYGSWIASPDFHAVPLGPDPIPRPVQIASRVYEILSIAGLPGILYWFVRGIRRAGKIDAARLLMLGWTTAYWLDPWLNFLSPMFTYNAYSFNRGCWCNFIPGWQSPHGAGYAEPLLIDLPSYFYTFTFTALASLWCMRQLRTRRPQVGLAGLTLVGYAGVWATMSMLDLLTTRYLGFDAWPGAFQAASFWGGASYQFPIYEFILFPTPFVACAFLLYYADANGQTAIERGVETITGAPWKRTAARILAFAAFCNVLNFSYTTAMGVHAVYADPWPAHMPSWLANGQCGGKTGIVCRAP